MDGSIQFTSVVYQWLKSALTLHKETEVNLLWYPGVKVIMVVFKLKILLRYPLNKHFAIFLHVLILCTHLPIFFDYSLFAILMNDRHYQNCMLNFLHKTRYCFNGKNAFTIKALLPNIIASCLLNFTNRWSARTGISFLSG